MKYHCLLALLAAGFFGFSFAADPPKVQPMSASLIAHAESMETEVRHEFQSELGHAPETSIELLLWLDKKSLQTKTLSDEEKDKLVQQFGATLGQVVIHEFGGTWVLSSTSQGDAMGVDLPIGKVAFVFNRAARRIFEADPIGFVSYFKTVASFANGTPLPADVEAKSVR
jgi:hypothetical protein